MFLLPYVQKNPLSIREGKSVAMFMPQLYVQEERVICIAKSTKICSDNIFTLSLSATFFCMFVLEVGFAPTPTGVPPSYYDLNAFQRGESRHLRNYVDHIPFGAFLLSS